MTHPFDALRPEYSYLLSRMTIRPECVERVNATAVKILGYRTRFEEVSRANGVPLVFMGPSFYREADLNFTKNPAQGWPLSSRSKIIPHNGPFPDWKSAAIAAYHLNGLDKIGAGNWTWELMCFYGELFNGFGYRDFHRMHSPYLWGGTNIQTAGKYTSDGKFDPDAMDEQLGIVPVMRRMVELDSSLALPPAPYVPAPPVSSGIAQVKTADGADRDTRWVQASLNRLGFWPELPVDGSYGLWTKISVEKFQFDYGVRVDGIAGPETVAALSKALANLPRETTS